MPDGYPATRLSELLTTMGTTGSGVTMEIRVDEEYASHVLSFLQTKKDWEDQQSTTRFEFHLNNADVLHRVHQPDGSFETVFCRRQQPVDQCTIHVKKHAYVNEIRLKNDEYKKTVQETPHDAPIIHVDQVVQVDESCYIYHGWKYSLVKTFHGKTLSEAQEKSLQAVNARYTVCILPLENTTCHSHLYRAVDFLLKAQSVLNTKVQFEIAAA